MLYVALSVRITADRFRLLDDLVIYTPTLKNHNKKMYVDWFEFLFYELDFRRNQHARGNDIYQQLKRVRRI